MISLALQVLREFLVSNGAQLTSKLGDDLLQENGGFLLQEDGGTFVQE